VFLNIFLICYAGQLLDDSAEDKIAEVRIGIVLAGGSVERLPHSPTDD